MRIGIGVINYRPALGGSARGVQMLAEGMARRGHEVTIVTQEEPDCPALETLDGVHVIRLKMRHIAGKRLPVAYLRTLRSLRSDILHVQGNNIWAADWFFVAAGWFSIPKILTAHGYFHWSQTRGLARKIYHNWYLPGRLKKFDVYVSQTQDETEFVVSRGYPRDKVHLITTGISLDEFNRQPNGHAFRTDRKVAVTVGGLWSNKRIDRLVQAIAATKGKWELAVIGQDVPGSEYDLAHCRALANRLGAKVRFLGAVDRETVLDAFASADAYVQGSQFEGFGLALLESMAADLPFVAFDAGAAKDLAATGSGKIVDSPEKMAEELARVDSWWTKGTSRKAAEGMSSDVCVERHLTLYESLVGGRR